MAHVELRVVDDTLDSAGLAAAARALRLSLRRGEIEAELKTGDAEAPEGARSGDALEIGVLVVQAAVQAGAVNHLIDLIRTWLDRSEGGDVGITLGDNQLLLRDATLAERQQLIEHFIAVTEAD